MIQMQKRYNGPGVRDCNLHLRRAYGLLTANSDLIRQYREESGIHSGLLSLCDGIIFNIHNTHQLTAAFEP